MQDKIAPLTKASVFEVLPVLVEAFTETHLTQLYIILVSKFFRFVNVQM